jgi:hypothetical protein
MRVLDDKRTGNCARKCFACNRGVSRATCGKDAGRRARIAVQSVVMNTADLTPLSRGAWACGLLLSAGAALAQTPAQSAAGSASSAGAGRGDRQTQAVVAANQQAEAAFQRADRNGDGRLTRAEAEHLPEISARFDLLDANRDNAISRGEFNRVLP